MASRLQLLKPKFKLATFDVTNTLLKFHKTVGTAYSDVGALYGAVCDPKKVDAAFRTHWKWMREIYPNYGKSSGMSTRNWWGELVRRTFYETVPSISEDQLHKICSDLFERYSTGECWKVCPGAIDQLDVLRTHRVIMGVISNFDERLEAVLNATGLRQYFQFVLASHTVGCEKPDQKIFDLALHQARSIPSIRACEAIHIGDNFCLDYMGAKKAGWSALLFHPFDKKVAEEVSVGDKKDVIRDMKDIFSHVFHSC